MSIASPDLLDKHRTGITAEAPTRPLPSPILIDDEEKALLETNLIQPTMIPVSQLRPNEYNPNEMTEAEFAEFVAEVRHLGRLPRPIVVRPAADGYVIVDGEHAWRAAGEVGLTEVSCEIIEADDFEAMRQTYKRNQHGTHDRVRLGQMFRQMKELRGLSNRALADETHVSEGTIRNALLYAEATEVRNGYTFQNRTLEDVRFYVQTLPRSLRDAWLDSAATPKDVTAALG